MSAVFTPVTATPIATNLTSLNTTVGHPGLTTVMTPIIRRGERSAVSDDDYLILKTGGRGRGAMTIWPDGNANITVLQGKDKYNKYAVLRLQYIFPFVTILSQLRPYKIVFKGKESGKYLCMNSGGHLYGSDVKSEECRFEIKVHSNKMKSFCSAKHKRTNKKKTKKRSPCIGFDKDGNAKPGYRVHLRKSTSGWFLDRNLNRKSESNPGMLGDIIKWDKWGLKPIKSLRNKKKRGNKKRLRKKNKEVVTTPSSLASLTSTTVRNSLFNVNNPKDTDHRRRLKNRPRKRHPKRKMFQRNLRKSQRKRGWAKIRKTGKNYGPTLFSRSVR